MIDQGQETGQETFKSQDFALESAWLSAIIESAQDGIISKTLDGIVSSWNAAAERIFGYRPEEIIGRSITVLIPAERQSEETAILDKIKKGERIEHFETMRIRKDHTPIHVSLSVSPIKTRDGRIIGASKIVRDLSGRRQIEANLKEQTEIVETIYRIGQMLSAELDQHKLVQAVTDAATDLTAAEFGSFFYNVLNEAGASYMLYTLSGVPREAFAHFPMPRATDLFGPTFRGERTIRIDDVRKDPRYGKSSPYYGMPPGHLPVVSYLAVPVLTRSGEVIGGLFFGHSEPDKFTEKHERIIEGLAAQAAIAMDNARLYTQSQKAVADRETLLGSEQDARRLAESANRAKDEFLGLLSHELRTPLNAILGWSRLLLTDRLDRKTHARAVESIERNARLQSKLIDDMLDISRIISGKLRIDTQTIDLTSIVNAAVDTLRPAVEAKDIRLYVMLDYNAGTVLGDAARLQQVIWNLLANAVKFTAKEGSIRISVERAGEHIEVTVSDTGIGIDEEFLPFIFERFRQADSSSIKKFGGLGLGLSIVRQIVELHGGTVEARNRKEMPGAMFVVRLPVGSDSQKNPRKKEELELAARAAHDSLLLECPPSLEKIKVLAVDDDADGRQLLATILEKCGAEVKTCDSAQSALLLLETYQPDVLVSDIGLPGMDGHELIRRVREREKSGGKRLPAVALTAYARTEDRLKALSAGFTIHVPKPVEPAELLVVIANIVR